MDKNLTKRLAEHLIHLEEFCCDFSKTIDVKDYILPFVCHSLNLKNMTIDCTELTDEDQSISLLVDKRKNLTGAAKLTIDIETYHFHEIYDVLNTFPSNNFINIRIIDNFLFIIGESF